MMASATSKSQKKLAEFLKEQQDPFVLEVFLLERGYSNSSKSLERSASSSALTKKRKANKALLPFSRILISVCRKLAFHSKTTASTTTSTTSDSHDRDEDIVSVVVEADRFSSASSSTVFNSCSEIDDIEGETRISPHQNQPSFTSNMAVQSQQATNIGKHCRRFIDESPALLNKVPSWRVHVPQNNGRVNEEVGREVIMAKKKITEESLLSAALWGLLIQSAKREGNYSYSMELRDILGPNASQTVKSKRALHSTKQLLFDCVRDIAVSSCPRQDKEAYQAHYRQLLASEDLGKFICDRTKQWGQMAAHQTNLTCLLTFDYMNSIQEWCSFNNSHVKDISYEIADAILEHINDEIVSDFIVSQT